MILLADSAVPVAEVAVDAAPAGDMVAVVRGATRNTRAKQVSLMVQGVRGFVSRYPA